MNLSVYEFGSIKNGPGLFNFGLGLVTNKLLKYNYEKISLNLQVVIIWGFVINSYFSRLLISVKPQRLRFMPVKHISQKFLR